MKGLKRSHKGDEPGSRKYGRQSLDGSDETWTQHRTGTKTPHVHKKNTPRFLTSDLICFIYKNLLLPTKVNRSQ